MTTTANEEVQVTSATGKRIHCTDPLYAEISEFLIDEADLLDDDNYDDWLELVSDDVHYEMPGRTTVYRRDGKGFEPNAAFYKEDRLSLGVRVRHNVKAPTAWYREPPPRTHRLVTNIVVREGESEGEYLAKSSIIMYINRFDELTSIVVIAKRHDVIRRSPEGLKLAHRRILADSSVLPQEIGNLLL